MSPFFKTLATSLLITLLASPLFAETRYPLTIKDGLGNDVTIKKEPAKISSKTLFTDELLLSMIDHDRLSSLTNIATDENFSNIFDTVPKKIPQLSLNVEAILNHFPDLVFAANWSDAGIVKQLKDAGIAVYLIQTPLTLDTIQNEILKIGQILNSEADAEAIVANMQEKLATHKEAVDRLTARKLVALDYNSWGTSSGVDTTWNTVLSHAGIINGSAKFEQGDFGQVAMSKELIVEINPDILFVPGWIYGESDAATAFYEQIKNDPSLQGVTAIKNNAIYQVPERLRGSYSQYIVDTINYVVTTIDQGTE